jgi:metallo-beta-lactamase class B
MFKGFMYRNPGYMGYANMQEWPIAVENVINRYPNTRIAVPGHGEAGGPEIMAYTLKVLRDWEERNRGE